jgi:hypothetical protein
MARGKKVNSKIQRGNTTTLRYLSEAVGVKGNHRSRILTSRRGPNNPRTTMEVHKLVLEEADRQ